MKYVGAKQVLKNIHINNVKKVYVAKDADKEITEEIIVICKEKKLPVIWIDTMTELGKMAGIDVGTSSMAE